MNTDTRSSRPNGEGMLSIGALSRASGIPVETLRTWERRYGFPEPERKPSGHRLYPLDSITRLRRIAAALALGMRAGQVVPASDSELEALLGAYQGQESNHADSDRALRKPYTPPLESPFASAMAPGGASQEEILHAVESFDSNRLTHLLLVDWARLGPLDFLHTRIGPLLKEVGASWRESRLEIRHEHFLSERIGDLLRSLRLPYEERAAGPLIILATLPGEAHSLGLEMAALVLASIGCRTLYLGTEVPGEEIALLAHRIQAAAVALSVSLHHQGEEKMAGQVDELRRTLPRKIKLVVGGEGAPVGPGVEKVSSLVELERWGRDF